MRWRVFGALVMSASLAAGASAQAADSAQESDSTQPMMQRMQQRMQDMQARMQQMHAQPSDSAHPMMQRMQQMQDQQSGAGSMQRMRGMTQGMQAGDSSAQPMMQRMQQMQGQQGAQAQTCVSSGARAGLSALLTGGVGQLALNDEQTAELQEILERARNDALDALTPEQRQRLESAPRSAVACALAQPGGSSAGAP